MPLQTRPDLGTIERHVIRVLCESSALRESRVHPESRLVEDLGLDSLDILDLMLELEEAFDVDLSDRSHGSAFKAVFTRTPFRVRDLAELVHMQYGTGRPEHKWSAPSRQAAGNRPLPFTQLSGRYEPMTTDDDDQPYERLNDRVERRRRDGMCCVRIPAAEVELGSDEVGASDERPARRVMLDAFRIDAEPVSTSAYARFLNSVGPIDDALLRTWFILDDDDVRRPHVLLTHREGRWSPIPGSETWPMMLVSWYGANAYALWAHGDDWSRFQAKDVDDARFLPTEAQWEYAARGARWQRYPWGDEPPTATRANVARHRPGQTYTAETLPLVSVNAPLGQSPFGMNHMAGNVWHWCRDWYDETFYTSADARRDNPLNAAPSGIRSERGGSWVGGPSLARSSYRRGRPPAARGRCLGFRCVRALN